MVRRQPFLQGRRQQQLLLRIVGKVSLAHRHLPSLEAPAIILPPPHQRCFSDGLLEGEGRRRVIVGSANLSETAFSGRQAETLIVFDDDEAAWTHYTGQYCAIKDIATSHLPLREKRSRPS